MARRFHGMRQRLVSQGRKTFWFSGAITESVLAVAGAAAIQTSLNAAALSLRPFTIVRTRGWYSLRSDQTAASEDQQMMIGGIVVSDQAVAIGVTAVPNPVTDDQSSWFFLEGTAQRFLFITGTGVDPNFTTRYEIDSKSMRKVEEGQDLITVVEAGGSSNGLTVVAYQRVLIKLH